MDYCDRYNRAMLEIRLIDERMLALQRQGRIGFYGEARGQEACIVGSVAALQKQDWVVPALREAGAGLYRGMPLSVYLDQIFGNAEDVSKGRQMPCHPCHRASNYVVMSSCVANQLPHAVGIAWGMKKTDAVCVAYMGDGGTSEADFHVAMNFASVFQVPVLFVCQNNQWAISTAGEKQTASQTYAVKGLAYDIESLRVDGNDVIAMFVATRYAVNKMRVARKPVFIEGLTYRVSAHSSSDDPSRYRDESISKEWSTKRDPVLRLQEVLFRKGWLTKEEVKAMSSEVEAAVRKTIEERNCGRSA